jgi:hypothetical protein
LPEGRGVQNIPKRCRFPEGYPNSNEDISEVGNVEYNFAVLF